MTKCNCGSYAINHHAHGRDGSDPDLCDVCYWRKRASQAASKELERVCAAIKTEDDYCVDQGDYMLDSDDCIKVARGTWLRPTFVDATKPEAQEGGNASAGKDGAA